jgi:hypothetical protein
MNAADIEKIQSDKHAQEILRTLHSSIIDVARLAKIKLT